MRAQLYPHEGPPVSSGRIQWRGVVEGEPFLDGRTHVTMGFSDRRAVVYPISRKVADRGRSRINWVAVLGRQSVSGAPATWNRKASKDRFFHQFKDWNFGWIRFADLICDTDEIYEFPEEDRDPLPRWSFGRVTLLGDAAHPMRRPALKPAVRQSWMPGFSPSRLPRRGRAERALELYEEQRRPIMNAVTMTNRKFGPAIVMELAEQRAPHGFDSIEEVITRRELEDISLAYKVEAGFDPAALNQQPSLTV